MTLVGSSPALLAACFLGVAAVWGVYAVYPAVLPPGTNALVLLAALPPLHNLLDVQFLATGRDLPPALAFAAGAGLLLLRAAVLAVWAGLVVEGLGPDRHGPPAGAGPRRAGLAPGGLARALRSFPTVLGVEAAFLLLALTGGVVLGGFLGALGQLLMIVLLVGGVFLLGFSPVVAVSDGPSLRRVLRLALRAARQPGPGHLVLSLLYTSVAILLSLTAPGARASSATPSIPVWVHVLAVSFLHLSVLAALAYRWFAVRERVLQAEEGGQPLRAR
ncbi:MAG TPA: hypothetical protein VNO34_09760 [Actinomycetota bacterium]|nr:hypothetical protein [Actinomycetota bacterium]